MKLEIAEFILKNYQNVALKTQDEYEVSDFNVYEFDMQEREILTSKNECDIANISEYEWLYHDKMLKDSNLECEFLAFIESKKRI